MIELSRKLRVLEDGSGWFLGEAIDKTIPVDIQTQRGYVAVDDGDIIGFITYLSEQGDVKIGWMGVDPKRHREGIGKALLERVMDEVKSAGASALYVETPTEEEGIGTDYEGTYRFYRTMGFEVYETFEGQSCDMARLRKDLD